MSPANPPQPNPPISAIPEGYQSVTPYLIVDHPLALIEFLKAAFHATELSRQTRPDGGVGHTEIQLGNSILMLSQSRGEWKAMPCMLHVYIEDVDAVYARALGAGATSLQAPADQPHGDRAAGLLDTNGIQWWIATQIAPRRH